MAYAKKRRAYTSALAVNYHSEYTPQHSQSTSSDVFANNSSCSVACFRTHKENHPPDPPKPAAAPVVDLDTAADWKKSRKRKNPFSVLDDSPDLERLFQKYPALPQKLSLIHAATLPPEAEQSGPGGLPWNLSQVQSKKHKWSHDTGLKRGKVALRRARTDPTEMGDAVREYCELVLYLLGKERDKAAGVDITDQLRKQLTQQDIKMIEQLTEEESKWN